MIYHGNNIEILKCPVCGTAIKKKIYKQTQAVYCSLTCAYRGRSLGITKRTVTIPYKCERRKPRKCLICNTDFIYSKSTQKYCSRKCFEVAHKSNMAGDKNPAFKDGNSYKKRGYRGEGWDRIRIEVYKRDKYRCVECGVKCQSKRDYTESEKLIQCHHIEPYNGVNNNLENLITLCLKCHLKKHN